MTVISELLEKSGLYLPPPPLLNIYNGLYHATIVVNNSCHNNVVNIIFDEMSVLSYNYLKGKINCAPHNMHDT